MRLRQDEILIDELRATLDDERANAEDLRQNCSRVVAENGRLRAAARKFLDEQTAENARTLRETLEQSEREAK